MLFHMALMVPVLLPTLVVKGVTCTNASNSDVFFKYSGHVEANMYSPPETFQSPSIETTHAVPVTPPSVSIHLFFSLSSGQQSTYCR